MKSMIKELWHGNIIPQEDSRTNTPQMKELLGYMARHHEELEKSFTDEQKETFEKFHDAYNGCADGRRIITIKQSGIGEISDAHLFCTYQGK